FFRYFSHVLLLYHLHILVVFFFFSSRRRHTRSKRDWSSDVCSSDLLVNHGFIESANIDRYLPDTIGISGVLTDNTPTAHLHTELVNVDREVSINVEPQVGRQFAVVKIGRASCRERGEAGVRDGGVRG